MSVRLKKLQSETIRLINETSNVNGSSGVVSPQSSALSQIKDRLASPITT